MLVALGAGGTWAQSAPSVTSSELPNGLRVIVSPHHAVAIAAIDIWVRAGTRRQAPGLDGVAHYLEHLLFTGTPTHPTEADIDGALEDLGGTLNAGTSYDWAHFYTVVPAQSLEPALGVMADTLQHATISPAAVDSERPIIVSEIQRNEDDPGTYAAQQARAALFGTDSPYGRSITGTQEQAGAVSREQVLDFYHKYYVPSNVAVVVSGDVTPERVQAAVQQSFGSWKGSPPQPEAPLPAPQVHAAKQIINRPSSQTYLVMAWPAPSVQDQPDVWTMDVLLTYLGQGGWNILDSDLRRGKHLVNSVTADFLTQQDPGILTITTALPTTNLSSVKEALLQHIRALRDQPLTADQLAQAKQQLLSSYLFDTETVSGQADSLGFYEMIDSYKYDTGYVEHVNSVTAAQVQQVAQKYLSAESYVQTVLTPPQNPENAALMLGPGDAIHSALPATTEAVFSPLRHAYNVTSRAFGPLRTRYASPPPRHVGKGRLGQNDTSASGFLRQAVGIKAAGFSSMGARQ